LPGGFLAIIGPKWREHNKNIGENCLIIRRWHDALQGLGKSELRLGGRERAKRCPSARIGEGHAMTIRSWVLRSAATLSIAWAGQASAANITAADVDGIVRALQANGYQAQIDRRQKSGPWILTAAGGHKFGIYFYSCTTPNKCKFVEFIATYTDVEQAAATSVASDWSSRERFSGIIYDPSEKALSAYHYLITGETGISEQSFLDTMAYFVADFDELGKKIVEESKPAAQHQPFGEKDAEGLES
jgi:hypothetical protein